METWRHREITLLLVEDDDVDFLAVERAFKKRHIASSIVRARDGIEGLAMLRDPRRLPLPYVVLLDINLPRMNGLEMLEEVRKDPALSDAVVFVLTTSKADEDKMSAYHHNVAGYMVKGHAGDGLMRAIEMLDHYWRVVELPAHRSPRE